MGYIYTNRIHMVCYSKLCRNALSHLPHQCYTGVSRLSLLEVRPVAAPDRSRRNYSQTLLTHCQETVQPILLGKWQGHAKDARTNCIFRT